MHSSIATSFWHISLSYIKKSVYEYVGVLPGKPLPTHTGIGCYPIIYLTKRGEYRCAKCASENDDTFNKISHAGIHYEGKSVVCEECGCEIESAYGED